MATTPTVYPERTTVLTIREKKADSLQTLLHNTSRPTERIGYLKQLSKLYLNLPQEATYARAWYNEAKVVHAIPELENAMETLVLNYDSRELSDSLFLWEERMEVLNKMTKHFSDAYFNVKAIAATTYFWQGKLAPAIEASISLQDMADEHQNLSGQVKALTNLGYIYQNMHCDSLAVVSFKKALAIGQPYFQKNKDVELNIYDYIILAELKLQWFEDAKKDIEVSQCKMDSLYQRDTFTSFAESEVAHFNHDIYWLKYYVTRKDVKNADLAYQTCESYGQLGESPWADYARQLYYSVTVDYFLLQKKYNKALQTVNQLLGLSQGNPEDLSQKVKVLLRLKRYKEATEIYEKIYKIGTDYTNRNMKLQLEQTIQSHQLMHQLINLQQKEDSQNQEKLSLAIITATILLLLLLLLIYFNTRLSRLKRRISNEKQHLEYTQNMLYVAKNKAEESDRLKSSFLANMSHEIRTPLNAIVGFSTIIADNEASTEECDSYKPIIKENSQLLLKLINDVLDLSKLEAQRYEFELRPTDINRSCEQAVMNVKNSVRKEVKIYFNKEGKEELTLLSDRLRLQQVLINLLTNAAKFTKKGFIEVDYQVDREKDLVVFTVTDTGIGIPKEKQKEVFNRFEKLNNFAQGTGLGLSICQLIVRQFEGTIYIDDAYDEGTRFIFTHSLSLKGKK